MWIFVQGHPKLQQFGGKTCHVFTQLEQVFLSRVRAKMQPTVFDEVFGKTNDFLHLSNGKIKYIKNLDITKLRYIEVLL